MKRLHAPLLASLLVASLALSACGGKSEPMEKTPATPSAGMPSMDAEQLSKIRECLEAAGLADDLPSDMPSDLPTDRPSERPTDMPSGGPGSMMNNPEARKALKACGLDIPEMPQPQG